MGNDLDIYYYMVVCIVAIEVIKNLLIFLGQKNIYNRNNIP